jgi:hypothetical protein
MRQLSIFEPQFDDRIRRADIDGKTYFSVLDVFEFSGSVGSSDNPRQYWRNAQKRLRAQGFHDVTSLIQHQFVRKDGKKNRATPVGTFKFFIRLVQVVEIKEWEHIRQWMADVAHERLEELTDPELGISRAEHRYIEAQQNRGMTEADATQALLDRRDGKTGYRATMAVVSEKCSDTPQYAQLVDTEYLAILGHIAKELQVILETKSIRDEIPPLQYLYIRTAEQSLREILKSGDRLPMSNIIAIARDICVPLGKTLAAVCDRSGIDVVTGRHLLDSTDAIRGLLQ